MDVVSSLTINQETREIADAQSRQNIAALQSSITLLQSQIDYIAMKLDIDLSEMEEEE